MQLCCSSREIPVIPEGIKAVYPEYRPEDVEGEK
jgi:hypothetical protein